MVVAGDQAPVETWLHPSPRLLRLRRLEAGGGALVVAIAGGVAGGLAGGVVAAIVCVAAACIAGLVAVIFVGRRVAAWAYVERDDDLLVSRGVLVSRLSVVPYGRMQFIDVTAGPLERSFRLATSGCTRRRRRATPASPASSATRRHGYATDSRPSGRRRPLASEARASTVGVDGDWHRLHPLSPLVRGGRGTVAIVIVLLPSLLAGKRPGDAPWQLGAVGSPHGARVRLVARHALADRR